MDGDSAIVGARFDDDDGGSSGSAYVFTRTAGVWTQQAKLTASDAVEDAWFGAAVDLDGDTALIGAPFHGEHAAYVFTRTGTSWSEQAKLTGPTAGFFGSSVSLDGNTAMVGRPLGSVGSSEISVFERSGGVWSLETLLVPPDDGGDFGQSVDLDGNLAVVGAPTTIASQAWFFTRVDGVWSSGTLVLPEDTSDLDEFAASVAVDGETAVFGAPEIDSNGEDAGRSLRLQYSGARR